MQVLEHAVPVKGQANWRQYMAIMAMRWPLLYGAAEHERRSEWQRLFFRHVQHRCHAHIVGKCRINVARRRAPRKVLSV